MFTRSLRMGRILGFPLHVDLSWLPIAALITWSLSQSYMPLVLPRQSGTSDLIMGGLAMLALFGCLILHELAHALTARGYGLPVRRITLFLFGGVAEMRAEPRTPKIEFWIAIAGPVASALLALSAWILLNVTDVVIGTRRLHVFLEFVMLINIVIAVFNMIPAFPMDGGRVLRSMLWAAQANLVRATAQATLLSRILAAGAVVYGAWLIATDGPEIANLWPILMGAFIYGAASQANRSVRRQTL